MPVESLKNLSEVLLYATYTNGEVAQSNLTDPHKSAEHHPYKTQYLFIQGKKIPKNLYTARLIQHYLIFEALEANLAKYANDSSVAVFFQLNFVKELSRTQGIADDLKKLGIDSEKLNPSRVASTTQRYVQHIGKLNAQELLIHYSVQVAGLMFGGPIVKSKYFDKSNKLPGYTLPVGEYDFSKALAVAEQDNVNQLFNKLDAALKEIAVTDEESERLLAQGLSAYSFMAEIYDDLLWREVYLKQIRCAAFFIASAGAVFLAWSMRECARVSVSHCFGF
jgi:heme oxygenase